MAKIQFDPKDEPYIESEPFGTCDWGGCDEEAVRWRWANEMTAHLPVCLAHSLEAEVATLTTERDAAEESRRFYMAERDRLREALQRMCFAYAGEMAARTAGVDIKGFPLLDAYQHAHFVLYGEDEPSERALAGTGETQ